MPHHKIDMTKYKPPPPPDDGLTAKERLRRTAGPHQMSWKGEVLDYRTVNMRPPRGEEPVIVLSKGLV